MPISPGAGGAGAREPLTAMDGDDVLLATSRSANGSGSMNPDPHRPGPGVEIQPESIDHCRWTGDG